MGMQSVKYDILNPAKTEKYATQYSEMLSGKIVLNKNNPISGYVGKAQITQVHQSESYKTAFEKDSSIFRKRNHERALCD